MRTFVFGLGAHKAGTSWLHSTLSDLPQVDFGLGNLMKEYHVLDAVNIPEFSFFNVNRRRQLRSWWHVLKRDPYGRVVQLRHRLQRHPEQYFDHFMRIFDQGAILTGDITPTYSALPKETLMWVRDGFESRGVRVRSVFLMRDPVERAWSSVRHGQRNERRRGQKVRFEELEELRRSYDQPPALLRGSYDATVAAMEEVFSPTQRHFCLYENLFTPAEATRLEDFLGVPIPAPDFDRKVNVSPKSLDQLPSELAASIAHHYAASYTTAIRLFGLSVVEQCWPSLRLLSLDDLSGVVR